MNAASKRTTFVQQQKSNGLALRSHGRVARRERGMSTLGVIATIGIAVFVGSFAFKVGPAYLENMTVNKILSTKAGDPDLLRGTKGRLLRSIDQAYKQNNLWDLKAADTVVLNKGRSNAFLITVKYEKRATLFGNVDVVTSFEKEINPED